MSRTLYYYLVLAIILLSISCGGDSDLNPTPSLSQDGSTAVIGKLSNGKAKMTIPVDEIGGEIVEGCLFSVAVNDTARHTNLNCETYLVDATLELSFVLPNLNDGDKVEVVITNGETTYIYTVTVSDSVENPASVSSSEDESEDTSTSTEDEPFYSPDGDDVDYITVSALDDAGTVTVSFPYDVIWDNADSDDGVVYLNSTCSEDVVYNLTYAEVLEQKDADGILTFGFSGCQPDDWVAYGFTLSVSVFVDDSVDLDVGTEQQILIPEVTRISMSND